MTEIELIVGRIRQTKGCRILPPSGLPVIRAQDRLPGDLLEFYQLCGGVHLFDDGEYPIRIVEPEGFAKSNPEIVGMECPEDISDSWYIVARGGGEEAISVDCNPDRLGRCYDSFWDRHGVAGDCAVVALSFTELLRRLFSAQGGYWYWLVEGGVGHGDAYAK